VVCYPDLVKVEVALDTGDIVGFEAKGYLTCHRSRDLSGFQLTQEEAETLVPSWVEVQSSSPALIPTSGGYETLCWEVLAQGADGRQALYYLNAETGGEEQIFLLEISPAGTLAV
jgi:germination protein YpeB